MDGAPPREDTPRFLVALDLDGTLLHHDCTMSPRVRASVRALVDAGHHVVVATGRSLSGALPVAEQLGLDREHVVCSNGAMTVRLDGAAPGGHEVVDVVTFDPWPVLVRLREVLPSAAYAVEDAHSRFLVAGAFPAGEIEHELTQVDFADLEGVVATRVVVRSEQHSPEDFIAIARDLGLQEVSYAVGWTAWLDLAPSGVSKATALDAVRAGFGVPHAATVAIGDGRNDVEMLRWAARSAAMGQAPQEVKDAASEVTASVDEDGAALVLESLLAPSAPAPGDTGALRTGSIPGPAGGGDRQRV